LKESELVELIVKDLMEKGCLVATEVANFHRSADIAAIDIGAILIIEAKISNVGQAIKQLQTHALSADYVYLAMPEKKISDRFDIILKELGIGIIFVDSENSVKWHRIAERQDPFKPAYRRLKERIKKLALNN